MKEFVAITDDMFYSHPELYDRLVPFSHDVACRHLIPQPLEMAGYADMLEFTVIDANGKVVASSQNFATGKDTGSCNAH